MKQKDETFVGLFSKNMFSDVISHLHTFRAVAKLVLGQEPDWTGPGSAVVPVLVQALVLGQDCCLGQGSSVPSGQL